MPWQVSVMSDLVNEKKNAVVSAGTGSGKSLQYQLIFFIKKDATLPLMALFTFVITSLAALFTSFLSLSPLVIHWLAPWIDRLGTRPAAPTPAAVPVLFSTPDFWEDSWEDFWEDFWEAIPTANLSGSDVFVLGPTPTFTFVSATEDDEQVFAVPHSACGHANNRANGGSSSIAFESRNQRRSGDRRIYTRRPAYSQTFPL
ncbi:hypothetical protein MMC22_004314 [Lobaria immixta]|nr:hypothetical protein [Lobaria immixta]